jgi:hypothetical protein
MKVALENTPDNVRCVRIRRDLSGLAETSGPDAGLLCAPRPIRPDAPPGVFGLRAIQIASI